MVKNVRPVADLRGVHRLTIDGIVGLVDLVEAMHLNIAGVPGFAAKRRRARTTGVTGLVYRTIRGVVDLVGHALDALLASLVPLIGPRSTWPGREALLAALNGVLGDYLAASNNPLRITMHLRRGGVALSADPKSLAAEIPGAGATLVVLLHGLCMNDLQWKRSGHDHGAALARDLAYTPVYLHYNSGLHISTNGRAFAELLESLVRNWPVPLTELVLIGHSMGGLVAHSACHYGERARHEWRRRVDKLIFLGTPHHGAPLERGGHWVDTLLGVSRYSAPLARLGKIRSSGITDLRFGSLVDEDWSGRDRFTAAGDRRVPVPLPSGVACYAIAATTGTTTRRRKDRMIGDGIVPLASALGHHPSARRDLRLDESRQWVALRTHHLDLLSSPKVYARIRQWLAQPD